MKKIDRNRHRLPVTKPLPCRRLVRSILASAALAASWALVPAPLAAEAGDAHPLLEKGFDPERVYELGDIDHVNLFNGNLMVTLPLGPRYPIRQGFSYGFNLVYNSQLWAFTTCPTTDSLFPCDPTGPLEGGLGGTGTTQGVPDPKNNAGAGWRLTTDFGELYGPSPMDQGSARLGGFAYADGSGNLRGFGLEVSQTDQDSSQFIYPRYSFDGLSMLRLVVTEELSNGEPVEVEVHRPDGLVIVFSRPCRYPVNPDDPVGDPGDPSCSIPQVSHGRWHLEEVRDPFGNEADLTVAEAMQTVEVPLEDGTTRTVYAPQRWTFTDRHDRVHIVDFDDVGLVARVSLSGFGGGASLYDFQRDTEAVIPGCPHDRAEMVDGDPVSDPEILHRLRTVTLPDGESTFSLEYYEDVDGFPVCTINDGRLAAVTLPTKGRIEYEYGPYYFPRSQCERARVRDGSAPIWATETWVSGVVKRSLKHRNGEELGKWRYHSGGLLTWGGEYHVDPDQGICELPDVTYTDVFEPIHDDQYKLTRHFFSVHSANDRPRPPEEGWIPEQYGLSLDRYSPDDVDPATGLFRASMVFKCVGDPFDYSLDIPLPGESHFETWRDRLHLWVWPECLPRSQDQSPIFFDTPADVHGIRERYVLYDWTRLSSPLCDLGETRCPMTDWRVGSERTYFRDDVVNGKARWVQTSRSRFDGFGNYREVTRGSNFVVTGGADERTERVEYNAGRTGLPLESEPWILNTFTSREVTRGPDSVVESYSVDSSTGFLDSKTTQRGSGGSLRLDFAPDSEGNVARENYSRGGSVDYSIVNSYEHGVLKTREYVSGSRTILRTVDAVIDRSTGLPSASWDTAGIKTTYGFDNMWRLTSMTHSASGVSVDAASTYSYQPAQGSQLARVTAEERAGLTRRTIEFNDFGWPVREEVLAPGETAVSPSRNLIKTTTYTPQGWVGAASSSFYDPSAPAPRKTRFSYDIFGRRTETLSPFEHPDGSDGWHVMKTAYLGARREARKTLGIETDTGPWAGIDVFLYNGLGELMSVEDRLAADAEGREARGPGAVTLQTSYAYDEGGRLKQVTQGAQKRVFEYDEAGFLLRECHPELGFLASRSCGAGVTGSINYGGHDALGNPTAKTFGGGSDFDLQLAYDGAGRLVQVRGPAGGLLEEYFYQNLYGRDVDPATSCSEDEGYKCAANLGNGKLLHSKRHNPASPYGDVVVSEMNTYAGRGGRLSARSLRTGGESAVPRVVFRSSFTYDSLGNPASVAYPGCFEVWCQQSGVPFRSTSYGYSHGLLTHVSADDQLAVIEYHPNLTIRNVHHVGGNGVTDEIGLDGEHLPRPASLRVTGGSGLLWDSGHFQYDGAGNVSRIGSDAFTYDPVFDRLSSASVPYPVDPPFGTEEATEARSYGYDAYGNLLHISGDSNPRSWPVEADTNHLTNATYDVAGNLTARLTFAGNAAWRYSYDALGAMDRVENGSRSIHRDFLYTTGGERVATLFSGGARELWTLRGPGNKVLRDIEYTSEGWQWLTDYVYRGSRLLASYDAPDSGAELRHYHLNHLGSPRLVTDASGYEIAEHVHAPFGEELTPTPQDEGRMKFTGHERDDFDPNGQLGDLDYMHARYFSAHVGRFLRADPLGAALRWPQSWNRYTYVVGNPIKYIDPYGLQALEGYGVAEGVFGEPYGGSYYAYPTSFFNFLSFGSFLRNLSFVASAALTNADQRLPGLNRPGAGADPCEDFSNVFFDTLAGAIEDIGPVTITGSAPFYPFPGLAGFGGSASVTARPDGSTDLYLGLGGVIGSSARGSSLGASFLKRSAGGRPGGWTLRGAAAAGLLNIIGHPLGVRGSVMNTQQGDTASVGLGVVGFASASFTGGYTFHVSDPRKPNNCR